MKDYETLFRFEQTKFGIVFTDKDGKTDCVDWLQPLGTSPIPPYTKEVNKGDHL